MTNRIPLIVNTGSGQIQELPAGDDLLLTQNDIVDVGNITATGNITAGNLISNSAIVASSISGNLNASNLTSGTVPSARLSGSYGISVTGTAATVTTAAQPNITSVGTLSTLNVSGNAVIGGNLIVQGNTTTINSTIVELDDLALVVAANAATPAAANGGGLIINGANASMLYVNSSNSMTFSHTVTAPNLAIAGTVNANLAANTVVLTNAFLHTARTTYTGGNIIMQDINDLGNGLAYIAFEHGGGGGGADSMLLKNYNQFSNTAAAIAVNPSNIVVAFGADDVFLYPAAVFNSAGNVTIIGSFIGPDAVVNNVRSGFANLTTITTSNSITGGGNVVMGNITANANITATNTLSAAAVTATTGTFGNVTANLFVGNVAATGNVSGANIQTGGTLTVGGAITAGSLTGPVNVVGNLSATGNIQAGNLRANSDIFANGAAFITGNLTAAYLFGNGSTLTGITLNYSNANVASYLPTYSGNITAGNISVGANLTVLNHIDALAGFYGNLDTANLNANTVYGNIATAAQPNITSVGNLTSLTVTGNATSNNYTAANGVNALAVTTFSLFAATANVSSNLNVLNNVNVTQNVNATNATLSSATTNGLFYADSNKTLLTSSNLTYNGTNVTVSNGNVNATGATFTNMTATANVIGGNIVTAGTANIATFIAGTVNSNLIPTSNGIYNLGSNTAQWSNLYLAGNTIYLGNVIIRQATNTSIEFLQSDGVTPATLANSSAVAGATLENGNSLVSVEANSNIVMTISGVPSVTFGLNNTVANGNLTVTNTFTANTFSFNTANANSITFGDATTQTSAYPGNATVLTLSGNITAGNLRVGNAGTFRLGSAAFYSQGSNGFSVNDNVDTSLNSSQSAYLFSTGTGRDSSVVAMGVPGSFTNFIGTSGEMGTNQLTIGSDLGNTTFEFRKNTGKAPFNFSGGTVLANIDPSGHFTALGNIQTGSGNIVTASGNITATAGNISGNYILGNGAFLSGVAANYGNANVAAYLPTYTGNLASLAGNVQTTAAVVAANLLVNAGVLGNFNPAANLTYSLGNNTNRWDNLWVGGNTIALGNIKLKEIDSTTIGFFQDDGTTPAIVANSSVSGGSSLVNGTSQMAVSLNGNITATVDGNLVGTFGANGIYTDGYFYANGTPFGGGGGSVNYNASATAPGAPAAGDFWFNTVNGILYQYNNDGDSSQWVDQSGLAFGAGITSAVANSIVQRDSQAGITVTNVTATTGTFTGNVGFSNIAATGQITAVGNISGAYLFGNGSQLTGVTVDATRIFNGSSNVSIATSGGNIRLVVSGANVGTISGDGLTIGNIYNLNANGTGNIGTESNRFNTIFAQATSAQYADLAEMYVSDANYAPGTVMVIGGTGNVEVTQSTTDNDYKVIGVISTRPAFLMNADKSGVAVALTGRVPCKVVGPITKGDLLVTSSTPGHAKAYVPAELNIAVSQTANLIPVTPQAINSFLPGRIFAKALQSISGTGTIEVIVGRY
jgi:hypothetical protein